VSYPTRMRYLLMQDFEGTVQMWRENPKQLDKEIRNHLRRAREYDLELKEQGLPEDEREELVYNFLAPTDVPDVPSPDEDLYVQVIEWAEEKGAQLLGEQKAKRNKKSKPDPKKSKNELGLDFHRERVDSLHKESKNLGKLPSPEPDKKLKDNTADDLLAEWDRQVDKKKWEQIRPLLKNAWDEILAAGKTAGEFVELAFKTLRPEGRPYFEKFVREEIQNKPVSGEDEVSLKEGLSRDREEVTGEPGTTGQADKDETQPVNLSMADCSTRRIKIKDKIKEIDGTWSQEKYIKAYRFAAEAHKGQLVPGTDLPYIMHLSLVSMEIMAALSVENDLDGDLAIQCALLHDTIEDPGIKYDKLRDEFGIRVADGVHALTKDESIGSDLSKQERKKLQMTDSLERIKKQPKEVWMVKLADRITNLQPPPLDWDQEKISNYKQEAKLIYDNLKDASKFLADRLKEKIDNYNLEKPAIQYKVYKDDNFHYMDESERDFVGVFSSAKEAISKAKHIVDRSLRWERLQATDPNDSEELYDRYKDFGDDPFIISEDPNCKFSAWTYAKERCRDIVNLTFRTPGQ